MNGYGEDFDAFFFCLVRQRSRKWFTTAWKSYKSEPFLCYAALACSASPSQAFQRKFIESKDNPGEQTPLEPIARQDIYGIFMQYATG
jgi:hypothetical protein